MKICHISTLPPTQCGIAVYTQMLMDNLRGVDSIGFELCYGSSQSQSAECIRISERSDYDRAVDRINGSDFDVVSLQHEFGIYGGPYGSFVVDLIERIHKPVIVTLHATTEVISKRSKRTEVLIAIARQADALVTLTETSMHQVATLVPEANVVCIRHGVPEVEFRYPDEVALRQKFGADFLLISAGFVGSNKGIDQAIMALAQLRHTRSDFKYIIVGKVHHATADGGKPYTDRIHELIERNNLGDHVIHINEFLEHEDLLTHIMASDLALALYTRAAQSSSGAVPYYLACGRPIVVTPFEYVQATSGQVPGIHIVPHSEPEAVAKAINELMQHNVLRDEMAQIYEGTRQWTWPKIAEQYCNLFERVAAKRFEVPYL